MDKFSAHQKVVLSIILASYFIIILDVSVVITGLPKILAELHFSSTSLSWVQSAYTLMFGGFYFWAQEPVISWAARKCI